MWFLSTYDINSRDQITGTWTACGMEMPSVTLTAIGDMAMGVPSGQTGMLFVGFPATSWNGVPPVHVTGILGGWSDGSSVAIDPVVALYGLRSTSPFADGTMRWPASETAIASGDLTYANGTPYVAGAGFPGILGIYDSTPPYYAPVTSLATSSPRAGQVSVVLRTQIRLYGKTRNGCTAPFGQAFVNDLNLRIVACQLAGTDGGSDGLCTSSQVDFIDSNTTQFTPGTGEFMSGQLPANASCADVFNAEP
jgi:hypothetical protein